MTSYVLPPTRQQYHVFGHRSGSATSRLALGAVTGAADTPLTLLTGPMGVVKAIGTGIYDALGRAGRHRGSDDVGALHGIRELGSDLGHQSYFQYRDSVKYTEILEAQLLQSVVAYLGDRVDISELTGFAETIVNHGIINYGSVQAGAVGKGAKANVGAMGRSSRGSVGK